MGLRELGDVGLLAAKENRRTIHSSNHSTAAFREECLNVNRLLSLVDAQDKIAEFKNDYS
jgi:hypothetical protein